MKWNYKNGLGVAVALLSACCGYAQNNDIFKGGNSDGWATTGYTQPTANIFPGGSGNGWSSLGYTQATFNIFTGGSGDGWGVANYVQGTVNIFSGGAGDGWSNASYIQPTANIFTGGNGDGWSYSTYEQATGNIYKGGGGDGWASSYLPQAPLPVVFVYFTAQRQGNNASLVQWKTGAEVNTAYFEVERSADAVAFEPVGKVLGSGNAAGMSYRFIDNHPLKGMNYYRLRQVDKDNKTTYTPSRLLRFDETGAGIVRYYPNPTNGILNIELNGQLRSEAIVINISNANGAVLNQLRIGAGASSVIQVPMSRYAKGIYFIQVKTTTVNSTQRVVLQ